MKNRILGSTFLIAGTTIGAGMLALPMTSASLGFWRSTGLLIGMWIYMLFSAGVMVEISQGQGRSIAAIAEEKLGIWGKRIAALSLLGLFWALLAAYIAGGSSILHQESGFSFPVLSILFTLVLGVFVLACTQAVDYANRFLFIIKIAAFLIMVVGLYPFIKAENFICSENVPFFSWYTAIPIFFTSFGFHGSIPSLISYLEGDKKSVHISLIVGSIIPLIVYICWLCITIGPLGSHLTGSEDVGAFVAKLTEITGHPFWNILINAFTFLAITTSFLGVALSLFDYISEWFCEKESFKTRFQTSVLTFSLPLVFALFYPKGFIFVLGFAAIFLSILAIILPSFVAFREKKKSFFLNKGLISVLLVGGVALIIIELLDKLRF